jgi:hypothetical protein
MDKDKKKALIRLCKSHRTTRYFDDGKLIGVYNHANVLRWHKYNDIIKDFILQGETPEPAKTDKLFLLDDCRDAEDLCAKHRTTAYYENPTGDCTLIGVKDRAAGLFYWYKFDMNKDIFRQEGSTLTREKATRKRLANQVVQQN